MFKFSMRGQSLFEVIIAIGVIALILVGVVSLATVSVRNSSFAGNNALATKYAQEGAEWLRQQRDASWSIFIANTGNTCLGTLAWGVTCPIPGTLFSRAISFTCFRYNAGPPPIEIPLACSDPTVDIADTTVTVSWTDAQGTHVVRSATRLTNWNR